MPPGETVGRSGSFRPWERFTPDTCPWPVVARERADFVVVSVFVNPTQFAAGEDLDAYPRTLEEDVAACGREGVALVWAPAEAEMYPAGADTWVEVKELSRGLCAPHREGHFQGVAHGLLQAVQRRAPRRRGVRREGLPAAAGHPPHGHRPALPHRDRGR